ncbi:MAG: hypothetical protein ACYC6O_07865 [Thermoleophilia bacterium]
MMRRITRGLEPMARIVLRMSENEHKVHSRFRKKLQTSLDQLTTYSPALGVRHDSQWSQDRD